MTDSGALGAVEVVEYTDPICSWAWGTEPKLRLLRWRHEHRCDWRVVMGGLVGDATKGRADWDPVRAAGPMSAYWKQTNGYTGQPYPSPMRRMAPSTDPAGLAVKAAARQGDDIADHVLRRFRELIFVGGVTPADHESFVEATRGVVGLDVDRWLADMELPEVIAAYRADWEETRDPNDHVRNLSGERAGIGTLKHSEGHDRYAFPTLVFRGPGGEHTVPGWMPYEDYVAAMEAALPGSTADPRPDPTGEEALQRWESLTERELTFLCGADAIPVDAVGHVWGAGLVVVERQAAERRGIPLISVEASRGLADLATTFVLTQDLLTALDNAGEGDPRWTLPTPCDDWDLRSLLDHMTGSARMVAAGALGHDIGAGFTWERDPADPIGSYRRAASDAIEAFRQDLTVLERPLAVPWGPQTGSELATMFAADQLVHVWDLAATLGIQANVEVDPALVARIRSFGDSYADAHREPGMFGPEQSAPENAGPLDRLAAFVGRRVPAQLG